MGVENREVRHYADGETRTLPLLGISPVGMAPHPAENTSIEGESERGEISRVTLCVSSM